jgi:hypothetical protein
MVYKLGFEAKSAFSFVLKIDFTILQMLETHSFSVIESRRLR